MATHATRSSILLAAVLFAVLSGCQDAGKNPPGDGQKPEAPSGVSGEGADGKIDCGKSEPVWEAADSQSYDVSIEYWGDCTAYIVPTGGEGSGSGQASPDAKNGTHVTKSFKNVRVLTLHCRQEADKHGFCYYKLKDVLTTGKTADPDHTKDETKTVPCSSSEKITVTKGLIVTIKLKAPTTCKAFIQPATNIDPKITIDDKKFITVSWNDTVEAGCTGEAKHGECKFDVRIRGIKP